MTPMQTGPHSATRTLRLGLIGGNIRQSRAPVLHRLCGELTGIAVTYDLIVPAERGAPFDAVFEDCRLSGMRGVNITYPFKEKVVDMVRVPDPDVARIGSVNTVVFEPAGPLGHNTDFTGFIAAYRAAFGDRPAGKVALVGAGGVGRAIAFALLQLGATELRLIDRSPDKARALSAALERAAAPGVHISSLAEAEPGLRGADGVLNATPMGMHGYPGSAVDPSLLPGLRWAFDAVYTPVETEFTKAAAAAGLEVLSGYELFFHQGIHAYELFAGTVPPDLGALRRSLAETAFP
jgi:quinate/shikimate dehydrogenase (NAD+)